jgi:hypothetical protein
MKTILFVKLKTGEYLFKTDSFWHKSNNPSRAKIYGSIEYVSNPLRDELIRNKTNDVIENVIKYDKSLLGYFIPSPDKFKGNYSLKDDITFDDLGDPTFLYQIDVKEIQDWDMKHDNEGYILTEGNYSINDYKQIRRDEILNEILK